jgi:hypothetical protein
MSKESVLKVLKSGIEVKCGIIERDLIEVKKVGILDNEKKVLQSRISRLKFDVELLEVMEKLINGVFDKEIESCVERLGKFKVGNGKFDWESLIGKKVWEVDKEKKDMVKNGLGFDKDGIIIKVG